MPAYPKRGKEILGNVTGARRTTGQFATSLMQPFEETTTGEGVWMLLNEQTMKAKEREFASDDHRNLCEPLPIEEGALTCVENRELSGKLAWSSPFFYNVQHCLQDDANAPSTDQEYGLMLHQNGAVESPEVDRMSEDEEANRRTQRSPLVIDIPCDTVFGSQENTEEIVAAAVLTSLSLSPVFRKCPSKDLELEPYEDGIFNADEVMADMRFTNKENVNRRTKSRRRKNSFKTVFQCTWPRCGKILTSSTAIIRHVRTIHLGPKKEEEDGFSDGEEEFYFNEIEQDVDEICRHSSEGSMCVSPPLHNTRRCRSLSDPSHPTQPPISPTSTRAHSDDNITWPLRTSAGNRSKSKRPLHQTVHTSSRKGRGDGKKCRKVYGMENRHLWCTQCRWKKACIKFVD